MLRSGFFNNDVSRIEKRGNSMESINRRNFLKKSTAAAAGTMLSAPAVVKGFAKNSPNDTINVAVVGIGGRGGYYNGQGHSHVFSKLKNVRVVTLCDVDERLFPESVARMEKNSGFKPKTEVDFRKVLEDKDVDAVTIATPDHWHALQTIWACQAGKDVYVEKPVSYTLTEGRKMVDAARKYNRVVQVGTNYRSDVTQKEAMKFIRDGGIGDVYMAKCCIYGARESIGHAKDSPVPEGVNWDLFLGPAPYRPFNENRFHYKWHWFWDTSTTEMGNNAVHQLDQIRLALGIREHPVRVHSAGGYYVFDSDQQIPNTQHATFEYKDGLIVQTEIRGLYTNNEPRLMFFGSKGYMADNEVFFGRKREPGPVFRYEGPGRRFYSSPAHMQNFIDCVRTKKWQDLASDILEGHLSTTLAHIANVSYRTGRKLTFNPHAERFVNDDDANTYLSRRNRYPYVLPDKV